jgi:predicted metal-dependent phosphoesterase TrpH
MHRDHKSDPSFRVDLHVHTRHSRLSFPGLKARDCYANPWDVYQRARQRGMSLVTFTDHDSIDGCKELLDQRGPLDDFFISEEVSVSDPRSGNRLHISVFDIDEKRHAEIQRLRQDARELADYLAQEGIPAAVNHMGSSLVSRRGSLDDLLEVLIAFPLIETRNGAQSPESNRVAELVADNLGHQGRPLGRIGGSDAHTLRRIGWTWTRAPAHDRSSFLACLAAGKVESDGMDAGLDPMIRDVYEVVGSYYRDVFANPHGHFNASDRSLAAGCVLLSLPLQCVALPLTATLFRRWRVRRAVRGLARDLVHAPQWEPLSYPAPRKA